MWATRLYNLCVWGLRSRSPCISKLKSESISIHPPLRLLATSINLLTNTEKLHVLVIRITLYTYCSNVIFLKSCPIAKDHPFSIFCSPLSYTWSRWCLPIYTIPQRDWQSAAYISWIVRGFSPSILRTWVQKKDPSFTKSRTCGGETHLREYVSIFALYEYGCFTILLLKLHSSYM